MSHAGSLGDFQRARKEFCDFGHDIQGRSALSRLCMTITEIVRSAARRAMSRSRCKPQTSLTMDAPAASAQAATSGFMVSIETGAPSFTAVGTPDRAAALLFLRGHWHLAAIGAGRTWAPTSRISAPCEIIRPAWSRARVGSKNSPPSEKEFRRHVEYAHDQGDVQARAVAKADWVHSYSRLHNRR